MMKAQYNLEKINAPNLAYSIRYEAVFRANGISSLVDITPSKQRVYIL
jgi:hypothetical protein